MLDRECQIALDDPNSEIALDDTYLITHSSLPP